MKPSAWEEKLAEMVEIRALARRRESTVGELVLGAARGALPPPHPDQWLPKADKQRHEDEVGGKVRLAQEGCEDSQSDGKPLRALVQASGDDLVSDDVLLAFAAFLCPVLRR